MYTLFGSPFTRALIVQMVMAEGDIPYELRQIDIVQLEHRSPEFLAINPAGFVPALITPEGDTLYETPAINLYLADRHGLTHLAPRLDEPERGVFLSGLFYLAGDLEPVLKRYFYPHRYGLRAEDAPAIKEKSFETALERLGVIDRRLRDRGPYHLGERFSLVDLTMTYWATCIETGGALEPYPAVKQCMKLVTDRPKVCAWFVEVKTTIEEYTRLQACGKGVK